VRETIDVTDVYADSHFTWPSAHGVTFVAGGDVLVGTGDARGATFDYTVPLAGTPAAQVPEPTSLTLGVEDRRMFSGGYGLFEWRPTARVTFSGGARLNVTFEERGGGEDEAARAAGEQDAGQTNVRPSGSAGVLVSLWQRGANHARVYASYRSTFKPAAFDFGLGEEGEGETEALLKPETANNYEVGLKVRALDGRVDLEADVFRLDFSNLVTATLANGLPALQNSGETRFKGVELTSDWRLPRHVIGRLTYSFHDSRFVSFEQAFDGVPTQLAGRRLEMSPRHLFAGGVVYSPDHGVFGSVIARYVGSRYMDKRNRALASAYAILDAGAGLRSGRWELRIDGRNLGDRRDVVSESELGDAQYYRLNARTAEATLGVRF
jgi:outer membrane receptor protein involved in Fe transport